MYLLSVLGLILSYWLGGVLSSSVVEVKPSNFGTFSSKQPVLIIFQAQWCAFCKNFAPTYERVATYLTAEENFQVGKVDIDSNQALAARFDVHSIPAIFLYRENKVWRVQPKSYKEVVDFVTVDYKREEHIPFLSSPFGPMGIFRGMIIEAGNIISMLGSQITGNNGSQNVGIMLLIVVLLIGMIIIGVLIAAYILSVYGDNKKYD